MERLSRAVGGLEMTQLMSRAAVQAPILCCSSRSPPFIPLSEYEATGPQQISIKAAEDVNVTFEDQQKINKFARNTSRITELKEEIEIKKKQLQNLEDACEDIMLADDDCLMIPYQIGDVFISHSQEETQEMLEEAKKNLQEEIDALEARVESIQRVLADLKVQLYAKFGSNINLEADDS
eukprot:XP_005635246.1 prefoldin subunit 4 isoform X1 [Canis lupus familiaris]